MLNIIEILDYIENNLEKNLGIDELSKQSHYSKYYLQRMFSLVFDTSVKAYIRERQMTKAAFDLLKREESITTLAYKYGFQTPEAFSKAFKKQHKSSPSKFSRDQHSFQAKRPLKLSLQDKECIEMKVRIEKDVKLNLIGQKHEISVKNQENLSAIPELWDHLNEEKEDQVLFKKNTGSIKGILGICMQKNDEKMDYWIGVDALEADDCYDLLQLSASDYAVFEVVGALPDAIQKGWYTIMTEWITTSAYEIDDSLDFELYTDEDPFRNDLVSEIWIKLK